MMTYLSVRNLIVEYPITGGSVHAVSGVSFSINRGETLGLVGESGCGKSSVARAILQLPRPTSGEIQLDGSELTAMNGKALQRARRRFQMIFQDPIASLNPRLKVKDIVAAPLEVAGEFDRASRYAKVKEMLELVGLNADQAMERRPHEFSGGQCQRISIARALILRPDLLVCDEPVSALDVSVQAQILNLLEELKRELALTMLFISHDLAVVKHISDRICVMYLGKICEIADAESIYRSPAHPYTQALLNAVPEPDPGIPLRPNKLVPGDLPSPIRPPKGCRFSSRCPEVQEICRSDAPNDIQIAERHQVACHLPLNRARAEP